MGGNIQDISDMFYIYIFLYKCLYDSTNTTTMQKTTTQELLLYICVLGQSTTAVYEIVCVTSQNCEERREGCWGGGKRRKGG